MATFTPIPLQDGEGVLYTTNISAGMVQIPPGTDTVFLGQTLMGSLTLVLPSAKNYAAGRSLAIKDIIGAASSSSQVLAAPRTASSNTLNGATGSMVALSGVGEIKFYSDGLMGWSFQPIGTASARDVGTTAGTVAAGDDYRLRPATVALPVTSALTPSSFTAMTVAKSQRLISPFIDAPWAKIYEDDYTIAQGVASYFSDTSATPAVGTVQPGSEKITFSGAGRVVYGFPDVARVPVPSCTASVDILACDAGGTTQVAVGFISDATGNGIQAYWLPATSTIQIYYATNVAGGAFHGYTAVSMPNLVAPFTLALSIHGRTASSWVKPLTTGSSWQCVSQDFITDFDMRLKSWLSTMCYGQTTYRSTAGSVTLGPRRMGLFGQMGWREVTPVVDLDGVPYEFDDGTYAVQIDMTGPCVTRPNFYEETTGVYMGTWKYDARSGRLIEPINAYFYDDGARIYGCEDPATFYDQEARKVCLRWNDWAVSDLVATATANTRQYYLYTPDGLSKGLHILKNGTLVTVPAVTGYSSFYELQSFRRASDGRYLACVTRMTDNDYYGGSGAASGGRPPHYAQIISGSSPVSYDTIVAEGTLDGESTRWMHLDGADYVLQGRIDAAGTVEVLNAATAVRILSLPIVSTTTVPGANGLAQQIAHLPVRKSDGTTEHQFLMHDNRDTSGPYTCGALLLQKANERSTGWVEPLKYRP